MSDIQIKVDGLDDLTKTLEDLVGRYPDRAGQLLRKEARRLRKGITGKAQDRTNSDGTSKRSLSKESSYSISMPKGYGSGQYVEISAKSPHFHLVERGHRMLDHKGQATSRDRVDGRYFMRDAITQYEPTIEEAASRMIDELLKEEGLI